MASYGAAKAAINHLTSTLAVELAPHGIRVVAVTPGTTLSPVVREALTDEQVDLLLVAHPLGRLGEPEDLGRLVVALVSDLGRAVDRHPRVRRQRRTARPQPPPALRNPMAITIYGVCVLTFMMVMYAMERRGPVFILLFAVGCALSSVYGFVSGRGRSAWSS